MPKHYKAVTNHVPIDYHAHLNRIDVYFNWKWKELVELFHCWKLRKLEYDDCQALIDQLKRRLTSFALDCNALPIRTPRQLMATAKAIARNAQAFQQDPGTFDPEVVARISDKIAGVSRNSQLLLANFECRSGSPLSTENIVAAARMVVTDLQNTAKEKSHRGGQALLLQRDLAIDLATIFKRFGGRTTRVTRFDLSNEFAPAYREDGPFHDFLELVLPPALLFARRAGLKMKSIRSMVKMSKGAKPPFNIQTGFPFRTDSDNRTVKTPVRRGNFFTLHRRRLRSG